MPKIFLSSDAQFSSEVGESILAASRRANIAIEHSCKNGKCGVCIAPVLSGETEVLRTEEFLETHEFSGNHILTCCRSAITDLVLDVRDLGEIGNIPTLTLPCRIDSLDRLHDDVINLTLRLPPGSELKFMAGQYIDLIYNGIRRSYSIANAFRPDGKLELHVKRVEGGVMSEYLFSQAAVNDLLRLEGPLGTFSYREDDSENLVFLATGTGIAPIKAILESFKSLDITSDIYVIWGGRLKNDLYLDLSIPGTPFIFVSAVSREDRDDCFRGYVQNAVLGLGLDLKKTTVYACGSDLMIRDANELLISNGLASKRFYSDAFVSSN